MPITISEGSPYKISIVGVQLICIGGLSTKYIIGVGPLLISEGCPQLKTNTFVLKIMFLIHGLGKCEGVGEDLGHVLVI